jgi:hypothetical protein
MFATALKNVILMILIILILHFVIKNMIMERRSLPQKPKIVEVVPVKVETRVVHHHDTHHHDTHHVHDASHEELKKYVFEDLTQETVPETKKIVPEDRHFPYRENDVLGGLGVYDGNELNYELL